MRHQVVPRKFGRSSPHRQAMFRNMVTALLTKEKCETTVQKAKDVKRLTERLITMARNDNLHTRRQAYSYVKDKAAVAKLFKEIGPRYLERKGGYARVVRTRFRNGDAAEMATIELIK
ncbi:MAG: 50S ribosomal protein L17 [Proteobacteria bacterium]|nr:MAG: 50S ribosomal protein L17 [Pseudomonadota bacterium]